MSGNHGKPANFYTAMLAAIIAHAPSFTRRSPLKSQEYQGYQPPIPAARSRSRRSPIRYPNKLARQLDRQGSLYGRVSIVSQTFNEIQARKFREGK